MQINIQTKNFTVLEIKGRVVGQDALILKTMLEEHIQQLEAQGGVPTLIFNMASVQTMDSAGLGVLITTSTQIRQSGGRTSLVNVNRGIRRMLIRTNLNSLFEFPKNLAEAIASSF
ncbi:STAS domain-containing protein [Candidatus Poribacteria bacterium]|nr:STAS domain-containing protein [Candidatus Poribacteria bacterium]